MEDGSRHLMTEAILELLLLVGLVVTWIVGAWTFGVLALVLAGVVRILAGDGLGAIIIISCASGIGGGRIASRSLLESTAKLSAFNAS